MSQPQEAIAHLHEIRRTVRRELLNTLAPIQPDGSRASDIATVARPSVEDRAILNEDRRRIVVNDSFISPLDELYGDISIGRDTFISGNTILYAAEGQMVSLGSQCNCQDNTYLMAHHRHTVFGNMVSIAHQAVVEDSVAGDFAFFGFRSRTRNCEIGAGAMIMHNTTVENVRIAPHRITPNGVHISTQAEADALPELIEANDEFKLAVQRVNVEFVRGYIELYERLGRGGVEGVGPNPITSFNPVSVMPIIGGGTRLRELVRIVGDVRIGEESLVGQRTAIRADEGSPIIIGRRARIGSRVTFHALDTTSLTIGDNAWIGDESVIHGPLTVGDGVTIEDQAVVFQATIGDHVHIGRGATIAANITIAEGAIVPVAAVINTQEEADRLPTA